LTRGRRAATRGRRAFLAAALAWAGAGGLAGRATAVDLPAGLQLYGFAETRAAVWTQSRPVQPLLFPGITEEPPDSKLAVSRTTLQLEADWRISSRSELHAVIRTAWEPRYRVDKYAARGSHFGSWELSRWEYVDPDSSSEIFREVWIRQDLAPGHSLRAGRQIVNWGESLAFRVADVINPNDSRTSLFFLDPQESRIPQWMLQGLHEFPTLPGAPAFEWIVVPPWDPEERRVNDLAATGSRWAVPPETRSSRFPAFAQLPALWTVQRAAAQGGAVDFRFLDEGRKAFPPHWRFGARARFALGPLELAIFDWYGYALNPVVADLGLLPYTIADYGGVLRRPDLQAVYTSLGVPPAAQAAIPLDGFRFRYPRENVVGMTGNAYVDALNAVVRFEAVWRHDKRFQIDGFDPLTGVITDADGLTRSDEVQWQIAVDLGGYYWPWLNSQGDFSFNLEYTQAIVVDHTDQMRVAVYETRLGRLSDTLSLRASTVYGYNTLRPSAIVIYQPQQQAWAVVTALGLTAPWDEQLTAELRYVAIGGDSAFAGIGVFGRKDFAMLSLRYEF